MAGSSVDNAFKILFAFVLLCSIPPQSSASAALLSVCLIISLPLTREAPSTKNNVKILKILLSRLCVCFHLCCRITVLQLSQFILWKVQHSVPGLVGHTLLYQSL